MAILRLSSDKDLALIRDNDKFSLLDTLSGEETPLEVTPTPEDEVNTLPLVAALDRSKRSAKAKQQPRDFKGRFIEAGANVKWKSHGKMFAGTVDSIKNGIATVKGKNSDGTTFTRTLKPSTLQTLAAKARLNSGGGLQMDDPDNNAKRYIRKNRDEIVHATEDDENGAWINREDGYKINATKNKDKDSNALVYQLYGPSGKSLGIFGEAGVSKFDGVISSYKSEGSDPDVIISSASPRSYSVPKVVQESINSVPDLDGLDPEVTSTAQRLASGNPVPLEDVYHIYDFFRSLDKVIDLYGGYAGDKWSRKIVESAPQEETPCETIKHNFLDTKYDYFVYGDNDSQFVGLIAVDGLAEKVYGWSGSDFGIELGNTEDFDESYIEYVDEYTAAEVAKLLHGNTVNDHETTFSLLDIFPEERNLFSMAHSEIDFDFLDTLANQSPERSIEAQQQVRGEGGRFGKVDNVQPDSEAKYFAILDDTDPTAVLDLIAVAKVNGKPSVMKRVAGEWVPDPALQASIEGPTPPPVSVLEGEEQAREVMSQVDAYDSGEEVTASGFAGIYNATDLEAAVLNATEAEIPDVVRRAKALNRLDLVPEDWRVIYANSQGDIYGEFGEVITASADSPLGRLENYWLNTDKIDWNSEFSIDYATSHLTKYLGEDRARAFATILRSKHENS